MENQVESAGSLSRARVLSLVLAAGDIPHEIRKENAGWSLLVPEGFHGVARNEIALFEEENIDWPPPAKKVEVPELAHYFPWVVLCMGCLMVFHGLTGSWSAGNPWFRNGMVSGRAVLEDGELWRLATALTLHSGPVHLVGNVLIGGFLLLFLSGSLGFGLAWWLSLLAGIFGNALNVWNKGAAHLSVGYSTSVFGVIGILCGMEMKRGGTWRGILLPVGAGLALLAMLGSEGDNTDFGAHGWGLAAGCVLGILAAHLDTFRRWAKQPRIGLFFFFLGVFLLFGCWTLAMSH